MQHRKRIIVTVHGTGLNTRDFADDHISAVAANLGWTPPHQPVFWGDLADAGYLLAAAYGRLCRWLAGRSMSRGLTTALGPCLRFAGKGVTLIRGIVNGVAGVVAYFLMPRRRRLMHERLRRVLADARLSSTEVVLLSHSLGCLITFDVLRASADAYSVAAWVSLGCPLALVLRTIWRRRGLGALTPESVPAWYNVYTQADPIAGAMARVVPVSLVSDRPIGGSRHPIAAHRYWDHPDVVRLVADLFRS